MDILTLCCLVAGDGLPQGCYCGKVFIVDNLRVDFGGLDPSGTYSASAQHAMVEDSLCQVSQVFLQLRVEQFSIFHFDILDGR